jgi:pyridinium-3,5-bisthiocarboxylic acid mononucleotide nickel chelatase
MGTTLWFNPAVGVAGDMLLGALFDVGASEAAVRAQLDRLALPGWSLEVVPVKRRGLRGTRAEVRCDEHHHHRPWSTIDALLAAAGLAPRVEAGARATFLRLAEAEATVHDIAVDDVHFHEVGAIDAIVDIVGVWAAVDDLGVDEVVSAPIGLGAGSVSAAHGLLPAPAPATLLLLAGHPTASVDTPGETATPTGVALLTSIVDRWGPLPAGVVGPSGFGAGGRDPATHPNLVGAVLTRTDDTRRVDALIVETTLDDVTPEVLGFVLEQALEAGADDAWIVPVTMKKGRPGHQLRVLCSPALEAAVIDLVSRETGTLGLRSVPVVKHVHPRTWAEVDVDGHVVAVKIGPHGAKAEHEHVARAAGALGRSARDVAREALERWRHGEA